MSMQKQRRKSRSQLRPSDLALASVCNPEVFLPRREVTRVLVWFNPLVTRQDYCTAEPALIPVPISM